ncbi:hypothetical protein HY385_00700 [Candidatus Daviesbacteria bacterium]|nr:hypothetical protein [Candidatus Daviesbacteria bacterium]
MNRALIIPAILSVFSALLIGGLVLILYSHLPAKLPLFYSLPWGQKQLISKQGFLFLPATLILLATVNTLITFQLHTVQQVLKKILLFSVVFINLIVLITALKILLIFI